MSEQIALSPAQAAHVLGTTRQTVYALIKRGQVRSFKVGRLTRIPVSDVYGLVGQDAPRVEREDVDADATSSCQNEVA